MKGFSIIALPLFVLFIIIYGFKKKVDLYDAFVRGAKEGLIMTFNIFPFIMGMVFAVNLFINTGFINFVLTGAIPLLDKLNIPSAIFPMALLRPISGTATLVVLNNILQNFGADSYAGRLASVIQGCTDTTFYVITLYFGSVRISKIRYALKVGLFADLIGIATSIIIVYFIFS